MYDLGVEPSKIRELFAYGLARKAEIGEENVFDFSIGNPSVPAPVEVKDTIIDLLETDPVVLHTYSPASGFPTTKDAVAASIRENFDFPATADQVYMTAGAAGGLAISIGAVTVPGDEVIVISPYFPEYKTWIDNAGCTVVEVLAAQPSVQSVRVGRKKRSIPRTKIPVLTTGAAMPAQMAPAIWFLLCTAR